MRFDIVNTAVTKTRKYKRVHILEELRQQPRWEPKGGGQGCVFTLTVVTAIQRRHIGGQQLPFPGAEGRVPPHDGLIELRERNADRWFAGHGVLHVRVRHGGEKGHGSTPLNGTTRWRMGLRSWSSLTMEGIVPHPRGGLHSACAMVDVRGCGGCWSSLDHGFHGTSDHGWSARPP